MRPLSIRWRLTLWYGAVLAAILVGFSGAVYLLMRHHLLALTDAALVGRVGRLRGRCRALPRSGGLLRGARAALRQPRGLRVSGKYRGGDEPVPQRPGSASEGLPIPPARDDARSAGVHHLGTASQRPLADGEPSGPPPDRPLGRPGRRLAGAKRPCARGAWWPCLLLAGPLVLAGALGGGYMLARKALAPVDRMVATAQEITATPSGSAT